MREVAEADREGLRQKLRVVLDRHTHGDLVVFPGAAWIVSAHNG